MSIDPLHGPSPLHRFIGVEASTSPKTRPEAGQPRTDAVEISEEGRQRLEVREESRAIAAQLPDVEESRAEKIAEIRARIESGFYDDPAVRKDIAGLLTGMYRR